MAATRAPRKGRRAKAPGRSSPSALATHQPDGIISQDDTLKEPTLPLTSTDSPNKATKVFAIPELLEKILLQLPRKDSLMCQRVNRAWKATVVGSVKLQRFLFLAAEKDHGVVALVPDTEAQLLSKYVLREGPEVLAGETHCQLVVPNPLVLYNADIHNRGNTLDLEYASYADLLAHSQLPLHNIKLLMGLFSGSLCHSACLEMFLTQPPVREVKVELNIRNCNMCGRRDTCCFHLEHVKNSKGLRVIDIFAAARSFYYKHHATPREWEDKEDIISMSIGFQTASQGPGKGVLLLTAEDMRLAKVEALSLSPQAADVGESATKEEEE